MIGFDSIIQLCISIIIVVLIFLFIRNVVLWYYKIDKRFELQKEQKELLVQILEELKKTSN